jgi:hypothetical protein
VAGSNLLQTIAKSMLYTFPVPHTEKTAPLIRLTLALLLASATLTSVRADPPGTQTIPFFTAFRVIDTPPFESDSSVEGRNGWRVPRGHVTVAPFDGPSEAPALRIEPDSLVERPMVTTGNAEIWTTVTFRSAGGPRTLSELPVRPLSSVVLFSATRGIEALDGDGQGGGTMVNASTVIGGDRWRRLTIHHDFTRQRYDLFVDGLPRLINLGFRDHVDEFHGFIQGANASQSGMANAEISDGPPADVPYLLGDVLVNGHLNAGDVVGMVNAIHGEPLGRMQFLNADMDKSGAVDAADLDLLINKILGAGGEP